MMPMNNPPNQYYSQQAPPTQQDGGQGPVPAGYGAPQQNSPAAVNPYQQSPSAYSVPPVQSPHQGVASHSLPPGGQQTASHYPSPPAAQQVTPHYTGTSPPPAQQSTPHYSPATATQPVTSQYPPATATPQATSPYSPPSQQNTAYYSPPQPGQQAVAQYGSQPTPSQPASHYPPHAGQQAIGQQGTAQYSSPPASSQPSTHYAPPQAGQQGTPQYPPQPGQQAPTQYPPQQPQQMRPQSYAQYPPQTGQQAPAQYPPQQAPQSYGQYPPQQAFQQNPHHYSAPPTVGQQNNPYGPPLPPRPPTHAAHPPPFGKSSSFYKPLKALFDTSVATVKTASRPYLQNLNRPSGQHHQQAQNPGWYQPQHQSSTPQGTQAAAPASQHQQVYGQQQQQQFQQQPQLGQYGHQQQQQPQHQQQQGQPPQPQYQQVQQQQHQYQHQHQDPSQQQPQAYGHQQPQNNSPVTYPEVPIPPAQPNIGQNYGQQYSQPISSPSPNMQQPSRKPVPGQLTSTPSFPPQALPPQQQSSPEVPGQLSSAQPVPPQAQAQQTHSPQQTFSQEVPAQFTQTTYVEQQAPVTQPFPPQAVPTNVPQQQHSPEVPVQPTAAQPLPPQALPTNSPHQQFSQEAPAQWTQTTFVGQQVPPPQAVSTNLPQQQPFQEVAPQLTQTGLVGHQAPVNQPVPPALASSSPEQVHHVQYQGQVHPPPLVNTQPAPEQAHPMQLPPNPSATSPPQDPSYYQQPPPSQDPAQQTREEHIAQHTALASQYESLYAPVPRPHLSTGPILGASNSDQTIPTPGYDPACRQPVAQPEVSSQQQPGQERDVVITLDSLMASINKTAQEQASQLPQQDPVAQLSTQMNTLHVQDEPPRGPPPVQATGTPRDVLPFCPEARPVTYTLDWWHLEGLPESLVCTRCHADHIANSPLASRFVRVTQPEGCSSLCGFWLPRVKDILWPQAIQQNDISNLEAYMRRRKDVMPCKGRVSSTGADGVKWFGMKDNDIDGFIACEACYEDRIVGSSFESRWSLYRQQGANDKWMCDLCLPYLTQAIAPMARQNDWSGFIDAANKRIKLPDCEEKDVELNSRNWYSLRRKMDNVDICEACYLDKLALTKFANEFEMQVKGEDFDSFIARLGARRRCDLTNKNLSMTSLLESAVQQRNFSVFWDGASVISTRTACTGNGIVGGNWWTLAGGCDAFSACEACYHGILRPTGIAQFFEAAQRDPKATIVCNLCPASPRFVQLINKFCETVDKGVFSYYGDAIRKWAGVPECPGIQAREKGTWWGYGEVLACQSCYLGFIVETPLGESVPLKAVYDDRALCCQSWSPRMRKMWLEVCAAGPPGSPEVEKALQEYRAFGTKRMEVWNQTVPRINMIKQMREMRMMNALSMGQAALMYQGANAMASIGGTTDGYLHGNSTLGYHETEYGVAGAQMFNSAQSGMANANNPSEWMQAQQLSAIWMEVE